MAPCVPVKRTQQPDAARAESCCCCAPEIPTNVGGGTKANIVVVDYNGSPPKVYNSSGVFTVSAALNNADVLFVSPEGISSGGTTGLWRIFCAFLCALFFFF